MFGHMYVVVHTRVVANAGACVGACGIEGWADCRHLLTFSDGRWTVCGLVSALAEGLAESWPVVSTAGWRWLRGSVGRCTVWNDGLYQDSMRRWAALACVQMTVCRRVKWLWLK